MLWRPSDAFCLVVFAVNGALPQVNICRTYVRVLPFSVCPQISPTQPFRVCAWSLMPPKPLKPVLGGHGAPQGWSGSGAVPPVLACK